VSDELISVVVPTYRRPEYLREALASIVGQTHEALEVIVADDANQPEAAEVVASFDDSRLHYLPRPQNLGMFMNIIDGLRQTSGRYVIKLDDDDFWHESLCEALLEPLEADTGLAVSFCDHWIVTSTGAVDHPASEKASRRWGRAHLRPGVHRPFRHLAIEGTLPAQFATLFRRDSIDWDNLPPELGGIYDRWLACRASRDSRGAYYVGRRLAYYRNHEGMDSILGRNALARVKVDAYQRMMSDPAMEDVRPRLRQIVADSAVSLSLALARQPDAAESRAAARYGLRLHPTPRGVLALTVSLLPLGIKRRLLRWRDALRGGARPTYDAPEKAGASSARPPAGSTTG
jgi:glycosyltransferase involved in cell wall biosynthesis